MIKRTISAAMLLGACLLFSCQKERDANKYQVGANGGPNVSDIISYTSVSQNAIPADGVATCDVTIKINAQADSQYRYVLLQCSNGMFDNGLGRDTVFANAYGYVKVSLHSLVAAPCHLTASVRTYAIDTIVQFVPAMPDDMQLFADSQNVDSTQSIRLTCVLSRRMGAVSDGLPVYYSITRADTIKGDSLVVPAYSSTHSDTATAVITNPFFAHGYFKVTALRASSSGNNLSSSLYIKVR